MCELIEYGLAQLFGLALFIGMGVICAVFFEWKKDRKTEHEKNEKSRNGDRIKTI